MALALSIEVRFISDKIRISATSFWTLPSNTRFRYNPLSSVLQEMGGIPTLCYVYSYTFGNQPQDCTPNTGFTSTLWLFLNSGYYDGMRCAIV